MATATRAKKAVKKTTKAVAKRTPRAPQQPASGMSPAQKKAMQQGRAEATAVKLYLTAIASSARRRGRQFTPEELQVRIDAVNEEIAAAPAATRVFLVQKRIDLEHRLDAAQTVEVDIEPLQEEFVRVAAEFGVRKGISYDAFREVGVPAAVLRDAGVRR